MKLFAAYQQGCLIDQVSGESEDTALAKLKMDRPGLEGEIEFTVIDNDYKEVVVDKTQSETISTKEKRQAVIIKAENIEITLNVGEHQISKEDIEALEDAAEDGMVVATKLD